MAGFKQHIFGGMVTGVGGAVLSVMTLGLTASQGAIAFILATLASIIPDIDSDTSKPVRMLFGYLGILLPIVVLHIFYPNGASMETLVLVLVLGYILVRDIISVIFLKFTSHRGIIHSIPAAVICGEVTYLLFRQSSLKPRILFACICFVGYMVHLMMDEIWSVDLMGASIKRSFGSAITFVAGNKLKTILAYLLIALLGMLIMRVA
ncbi:MAG: metal-dependent hydrolase [Verrucomicrobiota bacterium]|nr:metal-dependent hydrolase [Verrucomicrobiota bacterium]